jgi:hypothetical protein
VIDILKTTRLVALLAAGVATIGVSLAPASYAGTPGDTTPQKTFQTLKAPASARVANKLKAPGPRAEKKCNGKTTTECCKGLSYCSCFYFPGRSDDTHPTSCNSNPPPKG